MWHWMPMYEAYLTSKTTNNMNILSTRYPSSWQHPPIQVTSFFEVHFRLAFVRTHSIVIPRPSWFWKQTCYRARLFPVEESSGCLALVYSDSGPWSWSCCEYPSVSFFTSFCWLNQSKRILMNMIPPGFTNISTGHSSNLKAAAREILVHPN